VLCACPVALGDGTGVSAVNDRNYHFAPDCLCLMNPTLKIIDPISFPGWDDLLLSHQGHSFFHSSSWAKVLSEAYGYRPFFFTVFHNEQLLGLIPVMEVKSILTGRRGVSLPFSDYCQPIIDEPNHFRDILDVIIAYGKKRRWKYIELRGGREFLDNAPPKCSFCSHMLNMANDADKVFGGFRDSTKRNIKKAIKENVKVHISQSLDSVKEFYRLNCITRRRHGLPPQPFNFFKKIYDHVISKKNGFVVLTSFEKRHVASAVYFHFGRRAIYKYSASDENYQDKRPNNLVMWEAIKWYAENEFESLSFGRTQPENEGLKQFKRGWGANEDVMEYYKYDLTKGKFVTDQAKARRIYHECFHGMPFPLLRMIGTLIYKHIG
jgi:hypothetical protein